MTVSTLIDTSFLIALYATKDKNHQAAVDTLLNSGETLLVVPEVVLPELFYVLTVRTSYLEAINALGKFQAVGAYRQLLASDDLTRIRAIMAQYADARFDFVDTAIMALAERLDIRAVFTFDRRDFSIFRPRHCDYLDIKP